MDIAIQDEILYQGSLQNQLLSLNIISNYIVLMQTMSIYKAMITAYFDVLNAHGVNPRETAKRSSKNIAILHYLFSILFEYERAVNCDDSKNVDCIFLKELIGVYKDSGFYEAYLNYVAQYQVKNRMHTLYAHKGGSIDGGQCMMYIVMFAILMLSQVQSITIDLRDAFFKRVELDFTIYNTTAPEISPDTYMQMLLPMLMPMQNLYGSCVFNAVSYGNTPDVIEDIYNNILTRNYDVNQALSSYFMPTSATPGLSARGIYFNSRDVESIDDMRQYAARVYSGLIQIYENKEPATHADTTSNMNKNSFTTIIKDLFVPNLPAQQAHYDHYISTIKNKLHLTNLEHNTTLDVSTSPLIITFVAAWRNFAKGGHAFNILYNTASNTLCVFDMNSLSILNATETINPTTNVFTQQNINVTMPVYYAEKGFWDGSEFENHVAFDKLNIYANDTDLFTLYTTHMYNYTGINATDKFMFTANNMYLLNSSIPLRATNNFNGWGCSTLNICGKSAITMLETYYKILHRHREYVETLFYPGMMLGIQVLADTIERQWTGINKNPHMKETMANVDWNIGKLRHFQKHGFKPMSTVKKSNIGGARTRRRRCRRYKTGGHHVKRRRSTRKTS